eukprot:scaffold9112_cov139-Isochrysis_galbana.AAC.3
MVAVRPALPARRIAAENGKEDLSQLPATLRGAACCLSLPTGPWSRRTTLTVFAQLHVAQHALG